jgi:signal recognition particle subunit SEC65
MPDHIYVYPAYLERTGSRSRGRRVPATHAVAEASVERIVVAARSLGFKAEPEPDHQYPRQFSSYAGRVKVTKKPGVSKTRLLRMLAQEIRKQGTTPPSSG